MSSEQANQSVELTKEEKELILKALSYYQIHLFDEMSKGKTPDTSLDPDYRKTTLVIKKIHKSVEGRA